MAGDGTCILDKIKSCSFYTLNRYKPEVQNLILNKINECLLDDTLFKVNLGKEERLEFIMLILHLHKNIIRFIDNFDYPNQVPKLVFFLEREDIIRDEMLYIAGFLSKVGFDIVIFDPSGMFNLGTVLNDAMVNTVRLDKVNYTRVYDDVLKSPTNKVGFIKKLFS